MQIKRCTVIDSNSLKIYENCELIRLYDKHNRDGFKIIKGDFFYIDIYKNSTNKTIIIFVDNKEEFKEIDDMIKRYAKGVDVELRLIKEVNNDNHDKY